MALFLAPEPLSCLAVVSGCSLFQSTHINPAELRTLHPLRKCHTGALCSCIIGLSCAIFDSLKPSGKCSRRNFALMLEENANAGDVLAGAVVLLYPSPSPTHHTVSQNLIEIMNQNSVQLPEDSPTEVCQVVSVTYNLVSDLEADHAQQQQSREEGVEENKV